MTTGLEPILRKLRCQLNDILGARLEAVYLFGSQARGDARADSDIDILIVLREEPNYLKVLARLPLRFVDPRWSMMWSFLQLLSQKSASKMRGCRLF